jgi:hypothetical protein
MSLRGRILLVAVAGAAAAIVVRLVAPDGRTSSFVVLGAALVVGELLELRPLRRAPLPLSLPVFVVLARVASVPEFVVTALAAELVASCVRVEPRAVRARLAVVAERALEAAATLVAYRSVLAATAGADERVRVLGALAAAAVSGLLLAELARAIGDLRRPSAAPEPRDLGVVQRRTADLTIVTSGMLMAAGVDGIAGRGALGVWGALLFSVPMLAACYSFERVASIRGVFDQTIRALSVVPELGGFVRPGHAERVASLGVAVGQELGLGRAELDQLETAALLHHLGQVCLDDPVGADDGPALAEVAAAGAAILRATGSLAPAGDLLAAEPLPYRAGRPALPPPVALGGQILKIVSAFDEVSEGNPAQAAAALEALYSGPGYLYDGRVLAALERVLSRRGVLGARL